MENWNISKAEKIIRHMMLGNDLFSQWLNVQIEHISASKVELSMIVQQSMTNGFGIAHGGIVYSLCDSALAFASNSYGRQAVSIETTISHIKPIAVGDQIQVSTQCDSRSKSLARYTVSAHNHKGQLIALFKGTVFFTGQDWDTTMS